MNPLKTHNQVVARLAEAHQCLGGTEVVLVERGPACYGHRMLARSHRSPSPLPPSTKDPFVFHGDRADALYLHGYSSTPYEVRPLAMALEAAGIGGRGIVLPGHATKVEDLATVRAEDWLGAARDGFAQLDVDKPRIIVAASMGALLALMVAAESDVTALVLLAPSLRLKPTGEIGQRVGRSLAGEFLPIVEKAERGGDVGDAEGQANNPTYPAMNIGAIGELGRLRDMTVAALKDVRCPTLLFHGAKDRTVELDSTTEIASTINADYIETIILPRSQHILGLDVERDEIATATRAFLDVLFASTTSIEAS